ncbi:MAG TPA: hypothetical protein DGG95_08420 [Cytophagales bacterium]|nr:hypothetical protein [Cytophagales bacterium]
MVGKLYCLLISILVLVVSMQKTLAQEVSAGVDVALPAGDLSKAVGNGFGLSARYENEFGKRMSWLVDAGFLSFSGKGSAKSITMVPLQAGLKYYFQDQINGLYVMGELGFHLVSGGSKSETDFGVAPGIGYYFSDFDLGLKFQTINSPQGNYDYIGFRAAYIFPKR